MAKLESYDPFGLETNTVSAEWWPDGMSVTVTELSYESVQRVAKYLINADTPLPKNKREANRLTRTYGDLETAEMQFHTTLAGIVSWTFTDKEGKPIPVTLQAVKGLRSQDAKFIEEAIDALNPNRDESFPDDSGDGESDG